MTLKTVDVDEMHEIISATDEETESTNLDEQTKEDFQREPESLEGYYFGLYGIEE